VEPLDAVLRDVKRLADLEADPAERTDLYPTRADVAVPLSARLAVLADEIAFNGKKPKKGGGPD